MGIAFEPRESETRGVYYTGRASELDKCDLYCNEDPMYLPINDASEVEMFEPDHPEIQYLLRIDGSSDRVAELRSQMASQLPDAQMLRCESSDEWKG